MISRYVDPSTAYAEILFGLIMALTFTLGASLISDVDATPLRNVVVGAVACNVAWGVIDGVFFILGELFEFGRKGMQIRSVQTAASTQDALRRIREVFDERIAEITTPEERDRLYEAIHKLVMRMHVPEKRFTREGLIGACIVFVLVSSTSLPILLPALVMPNTALAIKVGNFLLVGCLFLTGYAMAHDVGGHAIRFGTIVAILGLVLVGLAQALGG